MDVALCDIAMRSPSEIAAQAVQDELYARAAFARLISRTPGDFRAAVESDPRAQTEFMARHILDYFEDDVLSIPLEHAVELIQAARIAARDGEPHVRCRVEKDMANVLRYLGCFEKGEAALQSASSLASQTLATDVHRGTIEFSRAALSYSTGRPDEAMEYAEIAIRTFEGSGACDRAYSVCLYDAYMKLESGQNVPALAAYQDAARRAHALGSLEDLARAYDCIAHCYHNLNDFAVARRYFAKAARIFRRLGRRVLEAKALRCVARMSIGIHGEAAIGEMEAAKAAFLEIGAAGEVCRSTLAIMEELFLRDPLSDLTYHCRQLEGEALALGVLKIVDEALYRLKEATEARCVTDQALSDVWEAFGISCWFPGVSGVATVQN